MAMPETTDATFYRSPAEAIAAPPERLAYVAAFDPAGQAKDAMAVIDCDLSSASYGGVVGWSERPTAGNALHHFGWNACSSAHCHQGHQGHQGPRRPWRAAGAALPDRAGDPLLPDLCAGHQARPPPPPGGSRDHC
jgi:hypothetical protein